MGNLHLERGVALKLEGDYDSALAELKAALAEEPNSSEAHHQLGLVYIFTGEFELSLEELKQAAALNDSDITTLNDLALTYTMLERYDEAKAGFEEVLRRDPDNSIAKKNLEFFT